MQCRIRKRYIKKKFNEEIKEFRHSSHRSLISSWLHCFLRSQIPPAKFLTGIFYTQLFTYFKSMTVTTQLDLGERVVWGRYGVINLAFGIESLSQPESFRSLLCLWIVLMPRTLEPNFKVEKGKRINHKQKNSRLG